MGQILGLGITHYPNLAAQLNMRMPLAAAIGP